MTVRGWGRCAVGSKQELGHASSPGLGRGSTVLRLGSDWGCLRWWDAGAAIATVVLTATMVTAVSPGVV